MAARNAKRRQHGGPQASAGTRAVPSPDGRRAPSAATVLRLLLLLLVLGYGVLGRVRYFHWCIHDDAYISFRYARNVVRGAGLHEKARDVVRWMCESFVEMEPNREHNYCCCAGGGVINCGPPYKKQRVESNRVKAEQISAAKVKGAKIVITPCHNCHSGIEDIIHHYELGVETKFLGDILYQVMEKPS